MATICDIAGASYPTTFNGNEIIPAEGTSLRPLMEGAESLPERSLYFDHFGSSAVRNGSWKLVRGNQLYKNRAWELYNLAEDRCETNDLITTHPEKAKQLEAEWLEWAQRVKISPYFTPEPATRNGGKRK